MRIGFISTRFHGTDGVSLEAAKWAEVFEKYLGHECFWFAGPNTRLRTSTVQGLSNTASLCMETRVIENNQPIPASQASTTARSLLGW